MILNRTQQEVVNRYMDATEAHPEDRMSIEHLLSLKNLFTNRCPDWAVLESLEEDWLIDYRVEEY